MAFWILVSRANAAVVRQHRKTGLEFLSSVINNSSRHFATMSRGHIEEIPSSFTFKTISGATIQEPDQHGDIRGIAQFAVKEHNEKHKTNLQFVRVREAQLQLIAGLTYYITIEAIDNDSNSGEANTWGSTVYKWKDSLTLKHFYPVVCLDYDDGSLSGEE